jgi:hypothetical protein
MICDSMVADLNEKSADVLSDDAQDRHNGELSSISFFTSSVYVS